MKSNKEIIEELSTLMELGSRGNTLEEKIRECLDCVAKITWHFHPGYIFVRARENTGQDPFSNPTDLSFPPNQFARAGRANLEGMSLFYASSCEIRSSIYAQTTDLIYGLKSAIFEIIPSIRNDSPTRGVYSLHNMNSQGEFGISKHVNLSGIEVSFGFWEASETMNLLRVSPFSAHNKNNADSYIATTLYNKTVARNPLKHVYDHVFWHLVSRRFSDIGYINSNSVDYIVSALISKAAIDLGYDGVAYPSVRSDGKGINIAIKPDAALSKIRFAGNGSCKLENDNGFIRLIFNDGKIPHALTQYC